MLFSLYPLISKNYFILSFILCLGTLQWATARNRKPALSLLGLWGLGRPGMLVGVGLVLGGFSWFFATTPGLFTEGLAGGELSSLFVGGGLAALALTRLAAMLWKKGGIFTISDYYRSTSCHFETGGREISTERQS